MCIFFFFKQKTAYEMRISDWSSDVCSSDLRRRIEPRLPQDAFLRRVADDHRRPRGLGGGGHVLLVLDHRQPLAASADHAADMAADAAIADQPDARVARRGRRRSEEHTSELPSLMRITDAVFCLKKKT